jgi:hypothetical protein
MTNEISRKLQEMAVIAERAKKDAASMEITIAEFEQQQVTAKQLGLEISQNLFEIFDELDSRGKILLGLLELIFSEMENLRSQSGRTVFSPLPAQTFQKSTHAGSGVIKGLTSTNRGDAQLAGLLARAVQSGFKKV